MCTGAAKKHKNNGKEQILDPPLLFWFSSLSLSFHSFTVSHAEQLQEGRFLKKTKASKATKASKGASSSGKGGKATSQPSEAPSGAPTEAPTKAPSGAPSKAPSGAPSVVPSIGDPCQAAVESSCGGPSFVCSNTCYEGVETCCKGGVSSAVCDSLAAFFGACKS